MKVVFPYTYAGSGSDVWTISMVEQLKKMGVDASATVYPKHYQFYPYLLKPQVRKNVADIVHTNSWTGSAFYHQGRFHVTTEHLVVHDPLVKPYKSIAQRTFHKMVYQHERNAFKHADVITAVSNYSADQVELQFKVPAKAIQNGIDTTKFYPKTTSNFCEPYGKGKFKLLFVGNFSVRKGADLLPKIMSKLGDNFILFTTTGLQDKAITEAENIVSIGKCNHQQLLEYYNYCDALLFPTRLEGLSLTTLEAMACGMPVVTSDCFSMPELIVDKKGGSLCPVDDVSAFVDAVISLADSPLHAKSMGEFNRERAESSFSLAEMSSRYIKLYEALLI